MPPKKKKVIGEQFNLEKYNFTLTKKPRDAQKKCINIDEGKNIVSWNFKLTYN